MDSSMNTLKRVDELLKGVQWQYRPYDEHWHIESGYYCPECGGKENDGHAENCELLTVITELESVAQAEPVAWSVNKKTVMHLAAELVRGAVCMADDETELTLEIMADGTVQDDDGSVNANPVLALSIADYWEEGVYPIDPCNPTAGREPEGGAA